MWPRVGTEEGDVLECRGGHRVKTMNQNGRRKRICQNLEAVEILLVLGEIQRRPRQIQKDDRRAGRLFLYHTVDSFHVIFSRQDVGREGRTVGPRRRWGLDVLPRHDVHPTADPQHREVFLQTPFLQLCLVETCSKWNASEDPQRAVPLPAGNHVKNAGKLKKEETSGVELGERG